jgi:hypothetical protein
MPKFTNVFHTLHTKMGIKYFEQHLVFKYCDGLHRYIQIEMEFLDISSLGATYRYAIKIQKKMKQNTRQFGSGNLSQQKKGKGSPKPQNKGQRKDGKPQNNHSKP